MVIIIKMENTKLLTLLAKIADLCKISKELQGEYTMEDLNENVSRNLSVGVHDVQNGACEGSKNSTCKNDSCQGSSNDICQL
jgi:hypothetical protein